MGVLGNMRVLKKAKVKKSIILRIAIFSFCVYIVSVLVSQQIQISNKRADLDELNKKIAMQDSKNEEMQRIADSKSDENEAYIERIARECLGFAKQGERVFVNIIGN